MAEDTIRRAEFSDLAEATKKAFEPKTIDTAEGHPFDATVLLVPQGMQVVDAKPYIDRARPLPERRKGSADLDDLASFIGHMNRHKDGDSVIFASHAAGGDDAQLIGVFDYNRAGDGEAPGAARWGQHRAIYTFPLSEEWQAWVGQNGRDLDQQAFAEFMEDRLADVLDPRGAGQGAKAIAQTLGVEFVSPSKVLEVSRGLAINVGRRVANHVNVANGTSELQFVEEHTTVKGAPLSVPGAFLIGIPVFKSGAHYQIPVRLRYRVRDARVSWRFELYRTDRVFDDAFGEAAAQAGKETGLPLFFGRPEV